jgi:nitrite reductase/ring-hydroxylating ferredoxin subunit
MGELLRRYWQPVYTSDELDDLPKKVKLLCEEFVVFRDKKGRVGALEPHCSHRGTSLEWGRVEEEGLRCCYHGWLYDTRGQCIDMPCGTEEFRRRMDVRHPAYPTTEYGGLVFVYGTVTRPPGTAEAQRGYLPGGFLNRRRTICTGLLTLRRVGGKIPSPCPQYLPDRGAAPPCERGSSRSRQHGGGSRFLLLRLGCGLTAACEVPAKAIVLRFNFGGKPQHPDGSLNTHWTPS